MVVFNILKKMEETTNSIYKLLYYIIIKFFRADPFRNKKMDTR